MHYHIYICMCLSLSVWFSRISTGVSSRAWQEEREEILLFHPFLNYWIFKFANIPFITCYFKNHKDILKWNVKQNVYCIHSVYKYLFIICVLGMATGFVYHRTHLSSLIGYIIKQVNIMRGYLRVLEIWLDFIVSYFQIFEDKHSML